MAANLNLTLTLQAWMDIVIKIWRNKISEMDIGSSGELFDSFVGTIISNSGGSAERIDFAFNYYGKFVDMGVGSGVYVGNPGDVLTSRRPKRWYSPVFYSQTLALRDILANKYGMIGASIVSEGIRQGEKKMPDHSKAKNSVFPNSSQSRITDLDRAWMQRNGLL